jgi:hypothetical protein
VGFRRNFVLRSCFLPLPLLFCRPLAWVGGQIQKRLTGSITDWAPPLAFGIFTVWWADNAFKNEGLKHRS